MNVMVLHLITNPRLELRPLLQCQAVALGNDRHYIDHVGQLLHHSHVDGPQSVAGGVNEEEAAMDTGICDVALTHSRQLFAEVGRVLVLDVLDDGIPAAQRERRSVRSVASSPGDEGCYAHSPILVVDLVTVARAVYNVKTQLHAVLNDDWSCYRKAD